MPVYILFIILRIKRIFIKRSLGMQGSYCLSVVLSPFCGGWTVLMSGYDHARRFVRKHQVDRRKVGVLGCRLWCEMTFARLLRCESPRNLVCIHVLQHFLGYFSRSDCFFVNKTSLCAVGILKWSSDHKMAGPCPRDRGLPLPERSKNFVF